MFSSQTDERTPSTFGSHKPDSPVRRKLTDSIRRIKLPLCLQGSETVIFPCECWLAKSEDDGETVRELVPSDIITEKLSRDGSLKVTEIEVEDALESTLTILLFTQPCINVWNIFLLLVSFLFLPFWPLMWKLVTVSRVCVMTAASNSDGK